MNWDDLRLFDAAASNGSLSAGAKALGLSQPQMSRRLRDLEKQMGVRLFDRTPQGLRPTAAGAGLIPLAQDMRRVAESVLRAKPSLADTGLKIVRIAVDEVREHFLTSRLAKLYSEIGDVRVEIISDHQHPDHEARMTDIQIRSCLPESETLIAKRLGCTGHGLYASRKFADRHCRTGELDLLPELPWLGLSSIQPWHPLQMNWMDRFFRNGPKASFNTVTGLIAAVRSDLGLSLLPHFMARESTELVEFPLAIDAVVTVEYLIAHRDVLRERSVRAVVDGITRLYRLDADCLTG
jgi:DNA-binding transcriptional LysR family regulator